LSAEDFHIVQRLLRRQAGIVLEAGKEYLAETRLSALALREGFEKVGALMDALQTEDEHGALHRMVVESLAITETSFFRDLLPFEALRTAVLPDLLGRRAPERSLSVWSAACSNGQEPYSLAMLLREHFPQLLSWDVKLLATDLSRFSIERARAGVYSQIEVNRGLPAALLVQYFRRDNVEWRIREDLRRAVQFRELNLAMPWPPLPAMDLILVRNVLLYFDQDTRNHVIRNLARALKPDGYLLLGGGETTITIGEAFEPVPFGRTMFYRRSAAAGGVGRVAA
jgi:chemotaxis protein methyltransferase CheR